MRQQDRRDETSRVPGRPSIVETKRAEPLCLLFILGGFPEIASIAVKHRAHRTCRAIGRAASSICRRAWSRGWGFGDHDTAVLMHNDGVAQGALPKCRSCRMWSARPSSPRTRPDRGPMIHPKWRLERWQSGRMHRTRNSLVDVRSCNVPSKQVLNYLAFPIHRTDAVPSNPARYSGVG